MGDLIERLAGHPLISAYQSLADPSDGAQCCGGGPESLGASRESDYQQQICHEVEKQPDCTQHKLVVMALARDKFTPDLLLTYGNCGVWYRFAVLIVPSLCEGWNVQ